MNTVSDGLLGTQLLMQGKTATATATATATTLPQTRPAMNMSLKPTITTFSRNQSLVWRLLQQTEDEHSQSFHRVGLLKGPAQSGKTSLLLEAAVDLIEQEQVQHSHNTASTPSLHCACLSKQYSRCVCAAHVILFKRFTTKRQTTTQTTDRFNNLDDYHNHDEVEEFPIFIRQKPTSDTTSINDGNRSSTILNDTMEEDWDLLALQRIRVHYYASWKDLLYALWTLQGLTNEKRPCRAIFVDDLVMRDNDNDIDGSFSSVWLTQILAVLADTADFMGVLALAAVEDGTKPTTKHTIASHFISSLLQLKPPPSPFPAKTTTANYGLNSNNKGQVLVDGKVAAEYQLTTQDVYEWKLLS